MRILLLGGTGAMGCYLAQLVVLKYQSVYVTTRRNRCNQDQYKGITYLTGNAHDEDFMSKVLCEKWDVIVDFMVYNTNEFQKKIELLLNSTSQYIYLSSCRVYADSNKKITEDSARLLDVSKVKSYLATDEYALTKARQENILINSKQNNYTIIRPYITYGAERIQLGNLEKERWLFRALNGKSIVFPKTVLDKTTTLTSGLDIARAMMELIGNEKAFGEAFHITSNKSIKWSKVLDIYLSVVEKHMGVKPNVKLLNDKWFSKFYSSVDQITYDRCYNREFDNSKISQFIDIDTFETAEVGLKNELESFMSNIKFLEISQLEYAKMNIITNESSIKDYMMFIYAILSMGFKKISKKS